MKQKNPSRQRKEGDMTRKMLMVIAAALSFTFVLAAPAVVHAITRPYVPHHYVIPGTPRIRGKPSLTLAAPNLMTMHFSANSTSAGRPVLVRKRL
jgi:hypothetical protein